MIENKGSFPISQISIACIQHVMDSGIRDLEKAKGVSRCNYAAK